MLRRLLELLSRNVVLRRQLPAEFGGGMMFISPAARLRYWKPNIYKQERLLFDIAEMLVRPGDVVWDAGANAGVFSVAAAGKAGQTGRVLAFEADAWLVNLVLRTVRDLHPHYAPIDIINVAIADKLGFADFAIAARGRAANFLVAAGGSTQSGGIRNTYRVLTISPDSLLAIAEAPNVIKMDIEGAELMAFTGGSRILNEIRPRIFCEVSDENRQSMTELFQRSNYVLFDTENLEQRLQRIDIATLNTLFLPSEDPLVRKLEKS